MDTAGISRRMLEILSPIFLAALARVASKLAELIRAKVTKTNSCRPRRVRIRRTEGYVAERRRLRRRRA